MNIWVQFLIVYLAFGLISLAFTAALLGYRSVNEEAAINDGDVDELLKHGAIAFYMWPLCITLSVPAFIYVFVRDTTQKYRKRKLKKIGDQYI